MTQKIDTSMLKNVASKTPSDRQDDPRDEETITRKALRAKAKQAFGLLAREAKKLVPKLSRGWASWAWRVQRLADCDYLC